MNNKNSFPWFTLTIGAALGYAASLFVSDKQKAKHKKMIEENVAYLHKVLTDEDEQQRIRDVFKKNTKKAADTYRQARENLLLRVAEIRGDLKTISKDKYMKAVKDSIDELRETGELSGTQLKKLKAYFEADYKNITKKE